MYTLRLSPATIRPTTSRPILRRPSLKISFIHGAPTRRGGGSALSATMSLEVADQYARALSSVANEKEKLDIVLEDMPKLVKIFTLPDMVEYFESPVLSLNTKHEFVDKINKDGILHSYTENLLRILVDDNRTGLIPAIADAYEAYYNTYTSTTAALVTSVVPLEDEDLAEAAKVVQSITGAKNVKLKTNIDESLLGGFTIRFGPDLSSSIDMSVKAQIDELTAQFDNPESGDSVSAPPPAVDAPAADAVAAAAAAESSD